MGSSIQMHISKEMTVIEKDLSSEKTKHEYGNHEC